MDDARLTNPTAGGTATPRPETLRDALRASEREAALAPTRHALGRHGTGAVLHALMEAGPDA